MKNKAVKMLVLFVCAVMCLCLSPLAFAEGGSGNNNNNGEIPDGVSPWSWLQDQFDQGGTVTLPQDITAGASDLVLTVAADKTVNLDLNGFTIDRANHRRTSVICVKGTLILSDSGEDGKITGSSTVSLGPTDSCGGIFVDGGVFTMNGGVICNNEVEAGSGAGVYVTNGGVFTMNAGTIANNTANHNGGGVYLSSNSAFNMNGGTISNNSAMNGGGVSIGSGSSFVMSADSTIRNNSASNGAGVFLEQASSQSSFIMTGGSISNNAGNRLYSGVGGGVYLTGGTSFTMSGGEISGNTASSGAGISVKSYGQLTVEGGSIIGNKADSESGIGGIALSSNGGITISGNPTITDNTTKGTASNLYLPAGKMITVGGELSNSSPIKITSQTAPTAGAPVVFTNGLNGNGSESNFMSDNDAYVMALNADHEAMLALPLQIMLPEENTKGTVEITKINGAPASETTDYAIYQDLITLTVTPTEGYELGPDGMSVSWTDENNQQQSAELIQGTGDKSNEWTFAMPGGDVAVSASFTPIVYNISYDLGGGWWEDGTVVPEHYTIEDDIILPVPARWSDFFIGWFDNSAYEGDPITNIPSGSTGDRAFYALLAPANGYWGNLQWTYNPENGLLNISGSGDIKAIQSNRDAWRPFARLIRSVKLVSGVTAIGSNAFRDCVNLTEIELSPTLERIDEQAFAGDRNLTQIAIPYSVQTIGEDAFSGCSALTDVFYDGINYQWETITIGEGNEALTNAEFHITATVKDHSTWGALEWSLYNSGALVISGTGPMNGLGGNAAWLAYKNNIRDVFLNDGVSSIGENAFNGCENLKSIDIPDSVQSFGKAAFRECRALGRVKIPNGVKAISDELFYCCGNLRSIYIPDSITSIGEYAFESCSRLSHCIIPQGVTTIGACAFDNCSSITEISIPESVSFIGDNAFSDTGLVSIAIPEGITELGMVFQNCYDLESVTLPESLRRIQWTFIRCKRLSSIRIPESVTYIGYETFAGCSSLFEITIPDAVTEIGYEAFKDCTALQEIDIPEQVKVLGDGAFSGCTELATVTLREGLETIGKRVFENCSALQTLEIPSSVTQIDGSAFQYCTALQSITIPDGVTQLGDRSFYACGELVSVTLPSGMTKIGSSAFEGCGKLPEITLPENIREIGDHAFSGCIRLTEMTLPRLIPIISEHCFDGCGGLAEITIPNTVTEIGDGAFKDCGSLARITFQGLRTQWDSIAVGSENDALSGAVVQCQSAISGEWETLTWALTNEGLLTVSGNGEMDDFTDEAPDVAWRPFAEIIQAVEFSEEVTSIGARAFENCTALNAVTIPDQIIAIGSSAFAGCTGLQEVVLSANLGIISNSVFADCNVLNTITLPEGLTAIGEKAFQNCAALTSVTIPNSVATIGEYAFEGCGNLSAITLPEGMTAIAAGTFQNSGLTDLVIPEGVLSVGRDAFSACSSLTAVTIPVSVTEIGEYAFDNCGSLSNVTYTGIPVQWEDISIAEGNWQLEWATRTCNGTVSGTWDNLSWILDAEGLLTISGDGMMTHFSEGEAAAWRQYISSVRTVVIEEPVGSVGARAFSSCTSLESVTLPQSLSSISNYAFYGCGNLHEISIPETVSFIGTGAFEGCGIGSITLPASLTSLSSRAFSGCWSLSSAVLPDGLRSIGSYAFSDCGSLNSITIPETVSLIGSGAFYNCTSLWEVTIPEGVTSIKGSTFENCGNLYAVNLPNGLRSIGEGTFRNCRNLSQITLPGSLNTIGDEAFLNCTNLYSMTIPDGISTILSGTFRNCSNLTAVSIPDSVGLIEASSFAGCSSLTDVNYYGTRDQWQQISIGGDNEPLTNANLHFLVTHTVTYDAKGGTGAPESQTKEYEVDLTLHSNMPTRADSEDEGYTVTLNANGGTVEPEALTAARTTSYAFSGWNTAADGSGASYEAGGTYTNEADVTLYARWIETIETAAVTLPEPTREGYIFKGWAEDAEATEGVKGEYTPEGEVTLYAIWEAHTYTVSCDANGGTSAPESQIKTQDVSLALSVDEPVRESNDAGSYAVTLNANGGTVEPENLTAARTTNYEFSGWNIAADGSGVSYEAGGMYTDEADVTLYAQWTETTETAPVTLPEPTREGYDFKGWEADPAAISGTTGAYTPDGNVTLYAIWEAHTYTVSYDANGGSSAPESQTKTQDVELTLTADEPVRENRSAGRYFVFFNANGGTVTPRYLAAARTTSYAFSGWNTAADGSGTAYEASGTYTDEADVTLYARWTETTETAAVTLPEPTREGYDFKGWAEDAEAAEGAKGGYTPEGEVTLYAIWEAHTYTVSYDANGGTSAPESQTKTQDIDLTLAGQLPVRDGYTFLGWATSKEAAAPEYQPGDSFKINEDTSLYALWAAPDFVVPAALKTIEEEAFEGGAFAFVKLSEETESIQNRAFADCPNLRYIYIPEATESIHRNAFEGVSELTVLGQRGSYAEYYAGSHGFGFIAVP